MRTVQRFSSLFVALALIACGGSSAPPADDTAMEDTETTSGDETASADIVDTAVGAGQFTTLVQAVQAAGLVETLRGPGPFTVFAPTDEAFAALPEGTLENLLRPENREQLVSILTYHVVSGDVRAAQVVEMDSATTVQGGTVSIRTEGGNVQVGEANVIRTDVAASNGVIHVIDRVLLPPS